MCTLRNVANYSHIISITVLERTGSAEKYFFFIKYFVVMLFSKNGLSYKSMCLSNAFDITDIIKSIKNEIE